MPFIFARAFVMSMWAVAPQIDEAAEQLSSFAPGLKLLRDSIAHSDERLFGEAYGRPIDGPIVIDMLEGDDLVFTARDGSLARVPIHTSYLVACHAACQRALSALTSAT